jgi:hypothetical protein
MINGITRSILLLAITLVRPLAAQEPDAETTASVPALQEFHAIIFSLWHTAWPNKDTEMMGKLLPDIEKGAATVTAATLPGILRDKKPAWDAGIKKLDEAVTAYRNAVETQDKEKLLGAAEQLHMRYEGLVRVIRPVLKELDAFHAVLYRLYHYSWPENNLPKIRESALALSEKMAALDTAALPKRLEAKSPTFTAARTKLGNAVKGLRELVAPEYDAPAAEDLKAAVTLLHNSYLALEKVFE